MDEDDWLIVATVGPPHGIKGEVKLRSYTEDPIAVTKLAPLRAGENGEIVEILAARPAKAGLIARFAGVDDRNAAERLRGIELYAPKRSLPTPDTEEGAVLQADLIGLAVFAADGTELGTVRAVLNHGASDILEIETEGKKRMLPFTREAVPVVDFEARRIEIDPDFLA